MKINSLGGHKSINAFVKDKLERFERSDRGMGSLFETMFSERENIMYEKSEGFRIVKTTYGEAYGQIKRIAAALSVKLSGLPRGGIVGIYMDNSLLWIEMLWAILYCGFSPLLLNKRLSEQQLEYALSCCGACAVISDGQTFDVPTYNADEIGEGEPDACEPCFADRILLLSSGTSEHVKICAYTSEELYHMIRGSYGIIKRCRQVKKHYDGQLKLLTFLPFYHIFGLVAVYMWFAFFSRTFVHLADMSPSTILNTVRRHNVTHIFAVPLFWDTVYGSAMTEIRGRGKKTYEKLQKGIKIYKALGFFPPLSRAFSKVAFKQVRDGIFGDSIIFDITGGSMIERDVLEFFNAIGYRLANGYGMSEIGITSVELSSDPKKLCSGSVGKPLEGITYGISDRGTLTVSGGAMAKYVITDGVIKERPDVFDTNDLAETSNGRYYIRGRLDDVLIASNGENINPVLYEEGLAVQGTNGICLLGVKNGGAVVPTLLVSVKKFANKTELEEIEKRIRDKMAQLKLSGAVGRIVYTDEPLIKGDEFKLNRKRLLRQLTDGTLSIADGAKNEKEQVDEITESVIMCYARAVGTDAANISSAADFFTSLGGGSLDFYAVLSELSRTYGVSFPKNASEAPTTAADTAKYIKEYDKTV